MKWKGFAQKRKCDSLRLLWGVFTVPEEEGFYSVPGKQTHGNDISLSALSEGLWTGPPWGDREWDRTLSTASPAVIKPTDSAHYGVI